DVLEKFHRIVGVGRLSSVKHFRNWQPHWKEQWRWVATSHSDIRMIAEHFSPWLGARRGEAMATVVANPPRHPHAIRKTHCKRGHPLDGSGSDVRIVMTDDGRIRRYCKLCARERNDHVVLVCAICSKIFERAIDSHSKNPTCSPECLS